MSKEELITAIRKLAEELGHSPTREELVKHGMSRNLVGRHFGTHELALKACNLEPSAYGRTLVMKNLFEDWAGMVRELKRLPSYVEYGERSRYSVRPLMNRFRSWRKVPAAMKQHMEEHGLTTEWADVVKLIDLKIKGEGGYRAMLESGIVPRVLTDRPMYGSFLAMGPMVCAPTNENGVLFLFGAMAERLGFLVLRIQVGFPDCEAWRVVGPDRLQRVKIEVELESRNFERHGHDPRGADLIVCWEHNWRECPLEVIELKRLVQIG